MGKAPKLRRARLVRADPVGLDTGSLDPMSALGAAAADLAGDLVADDNVSMETSADAEEVRVPLFAKFSAAIPSDREWACSAAGQLALDPATLPRLLAGNIVDLLVQRLHDSDERVILAAAGALRNIALEGGDDLCRTLVSVARLHDISSTLLARTLSLLSTGAPTDDNFRRLLALAEQLLVFLWTLVECSSAAVDDLTSGSLFFPLLPALVASCASAFSDATTAPPAAVVALASAAGQLLLALSEDNAVLEQRIATEQPTLGASLVQMIANSASTSGSLLCVRVLFGGVVYNLHRACTASIGSPAAPLALPVFAQALVISSSNISEGLVSAASTASTTAPTAARDADLSRRLIDARATLQAQQIALEVLCNIIANGAPAADDDGEEDDDGWVDDEDDKAMADGKPAPHADEADALCFAALSSGPLPQLIVCHVDGLSVAAKSALAAWKASANAATRIATFIEGVLVVDYEKHLRVLAAVGNLCAARFNPSEIAPFDDLWPRVARLVTFPNPERPLDLPISEAAVSVLFSIMRLVDQQERPPQVAGSVSAEDVKALFAFAGASGVSTDATAAVLGTMGLLGKHAHSPPVALAIGSELCLPLRNRSSVAVMSECLNAIFDLFGEAEYNDVYVQLGLQQLLSECFTLFTQALPASKKTLTKAVYNRADEALLNLGRFIEYKQSELAAHN